jgi:hypothetical protein
MDTTSLQLSLRLAKDPDVPTYEVRIALSEVDVLVEVLDVDLRRALVTAANRCSERLRERGYDVSPNDVIGALEEALEAPEVVQTAARLN